MGQPQEVFLKVLWWSDLIWLRYLGCTNVYLFVCLFFFCLQICFFVLIIIGYPQKISLEIRLDSAELFRILKMFICLFFVCLFVDLFVFFILIIFEHAQEYTLKILWWLDLIWLRYIGFQKMFICLFVCLFVYIFVCFLFQSSWDTHRKFPWKFYEDPTWFGWDI